MRPGQMTMLQARPPFSEMARVMAKYKFDATIIFMAVAGEEQGLLGSTYAAEQAKQEGVDVEAMFTNDIIGSSLGGNGIRDARNRPRVFWRDVPSNEKPEEATVRRGVGGENDSASRQLARFIREAGARYVPGHARNDGLTVAIATCVGGDHIRLSNAVLRPSDLPNRMKTIATSTRMCSIENGVQYGDLPPV